MEYTKSQRTFFYNCWELTEANVEVPKEIAKNVTCAADNGYTM